MANRLTLSVAVGESLTHIIRPVAGQVLNYIIERLGYVEKFKDAVEIVSDFHSVSKTTDANGAPRIIADRVRAKLNPNINPTQMKWEGNGQTVDLGNGNTLITGAGANAKRTPWGVHGFPDQKVSVFTDEPNFIDLTERLVGSTFSMEVKMTFVDAVDATEALTRIFQCFINGDMTGYVDVQYDYPVPKEIQQTLRYLYDLRGPRPNVENDNCLKWVTDGSANMITLLVNRNRPEHKEVVVNKNNFQAVYQIECSQEFPNPIQPDGAEIDFTVTCQYARSNRLVLSYPIVVNNQYVEGSYVPMDPEYRQSPNPSPMMWQNPNVTKVWESIYARGKRPPVRYPWWDPWELPWDSRIVQLGYRPITTIAFTLDNLEDPEGVTTIDLIDGLPGVELTEDVQEVIQTKKNACLRVNEQVNVSVFADDYQVDPALLDLSDGKHLIIKKKRLESTCRLVISVRPPDVKNRLDWNRVWYVTIHPKKG